MRRVGDNALHLPEVKVGTTGGGVSSVLSRMPHKIAMEFLLVGEEMSAERAYQIGFVNKVVPKGQHVVLAPGDGRKVAAAAPLVVRALKSSPATPCPRDRLKRSPRCAGCSTPCGTSEDLKEGVKAFAEKRKPDFRGR